MVFEPAACFPRRPGSARRPIGRVVEDSLPALPAYCGITPIQESSSCISRRSSPGGTQGTTKAIQVALLVPVEEKEWMVIGSGVNEASPNCDDEGTVIEEEAEGGRMDSLIVPAEEKGKKEVEVVGTDSPIAPLEEEEKEVVAEMESTALLVSTLQLLASARSHRSNRKSTRRLSRALVSEFWRRVRRRSRLDWQR